MSGCWAWRLESRTAQPGAGVRGLADACGGHLERSLGSSLATAGSGCSFGSGSGRKNLITHTLFLLGVRGAHILFLGLVMPRLSVAFLFGGALRGWAFL